MAKARRRYRTRVALSYPTDPAIIARLQAGEQIPLQDRRLRQAEAGEVVGDIPACSIPWLLEQGAIEEVADEWQNMEATM